MIKVIFRAAAWLLAAMIVTLSLVPPLYRPVTATPHGIEHFAIFLVAGLAFGLGYRSRHAHQAAALVLLAGAVEIAQMLWAPGRHARISDFVVDALSACVGTLLAWFVVRALHKSKFAA